MKRIIPLVLALLFGLGGVAAASGVTGQSVLYRYDSSHTYPAILTRDNGDSTWALVALDTDGYSTGFPMGASSQTYFATIYVDAAAEDDSGTSDNHWRPNPSIGLGEQGPQGPAGATGATGATGTTGATGATGPGALVTGSSTPSFSLNGSAIQLDASHDTELAVSVKISNALSVSGGTAGHVDLVCDSSSSPSTIVETVSAENTGTLTIGLALTVSTTQVLRFRVPAAHYCKLTTTNDTGTPTYTLIRQVAQTLGG